MNLTQTHRSGALHEDIGRTSEVKGSSDRSFGFVFAAVFSVVAVWSVPSEGEVAWWAAAVALGFATVAVYRPALLAPANRLWFRFGMALGRITTPLVLAIIFFGVLTPTALLMRATGRDALRLRRQEAGASWVRRDAGGTDMTQQF